MAASRLGGLLGGLDALLSELHQTDVRWHDVTPLGNPRVGFGPPEDGWNFP